MMRLGVAHEWGFALAVFCSLLGVLAGGALPQGMWLCLLAVPCSAWQSLYRRPLPVVWGTVIAIVFFGLGCAHLMLSGMQHALVAACIFLMGILVARLVTRVWPSHDLQALMLSLLLMFAGTVLHQEFTYALVLVVYTVAITWALLTRQLITGCVLAFFRNGSQAELDASLARRDVVTPRFFFTVACLAWVILCCTGLLFVLFPRVGMRGMGVTDALGHMPAGISLTGPPRAQASHAVVVRLGGLDEAAVDAGLYLRGRIYNALGPTGFHRSEAMAHVRPSHMLLAPSGKPLTYTLYSVPVDGDILLHLGPVLSATRLQSDADAQGSSGPDVVTTATGEVVSLEPVTAPMRLSITGYNVPLRAGVAGHRAATATLDDAHFAQAFLDLPKNLDPRIATLAHAIVGDAVTLADKAARLRTYLLENFTYSLAQPNAARKDPLAGFLFTDRRGHCEYFATAYAVLLRHVGIPSRVVGGYQGGVWDPQDHLVLFTGENAHAWVEWYLPQAGWVVDDATPPSQAQALSATQMWLEHLRTQWDDSVLRFGLTEQLALWHGMTHAVTTALPSAAGGNLWASPSRWDSRQLAWVVGLGIPACALAIALWRRFLARRQGPALERALYRATCRLWGGPMPPALAYGDVVSALAARGIVLPDETQHTLQNAVATYHAIRFAPHAHPVRTRLLCQRLRALPPA